MSYVERYTVDVTTATGGGATEFTPVAKGRVVWVGYTKDDFATGVDFTVTTELTGQTIWDEDNVDASKEVYPLAQAQATDGTDLNTAGDVSVSPIWCANERIKIAIANGGNTKSGSFEVLVA